MAYPNKLFIRDVVRDLSDPPIKITATAEETYSYENKNTNPTDEKQVTSYFSQWTQTVLDQTMAHLKISYDVKLASNPYAFSIMQNSCKL